MSRKRTNLSKSSYDSVDDYARDLRRSGGPGLADLDGLGVGPGENVELHRAIWGTSEADFDKSIVYERQQQQQNRPHVFVQKRRTSP